MDSRENRNKKISMAVSIGVHAALLVVFFVMLAWVEPDPPIPEYGIELSFATIPANQSQDAFDAPKESEDIEQEMTEVETAEPSETKSVEETTAESSESIEEAMVEEDAREEVMTEDLNSPDVVEETANEEEAIAESEEVGINEESKDLETVIGESEEENTVQEERVIDERALFKKNEEVGDSEAKGSSLDLAGWQWDFRPEPDDQSDENGKIVFQISIDEEGEIIRIRTLEKTVSPVVEKIYRDAVMELTFHKTADNKVAAATSTGKITFIIKSK